MSRELVTHSEKYITQVKDQADQLTGQYYIHLKYSRRPDILKRTTIATNKSNLFRSNKDKVGNNSKSHANKLVALLDKYKDIFGYSAAGSQAANSLTFMNSILLEFGLDQEDGNTLEVIKKNERHTLYKSKNYDIKNAKKYISEYWHALNSGHRVSNAVFVGMVSMFDEIIARLIKASLSEVPELMNSFSLSVPYKEIIASSDFDNLRSSLIEKTVNELMWQGRSEQIAWIEKNITKSEISKIYKNFDMFVELTERRNLFVHNDGVVNREYLHKISKQNLPYETPSLGDRLYPDKEYFSNSSDILIELYVLLSQLVVRSLLRGELKKDNELKEFVDDSLNDASYFQLCESRFRSSSIISRYATDEILKVSDLYNKMCNVNLSIACKSYGDSKLCKEILDSVDWSSSINEFKLCISAIKEDLNEFKALLPSVRNSTMLDASSFYEWPAFEWLRSKGEFWQALHEVYGDEIKLVVDVDTASTTIE